jgi:hypothetical protein
VLFSECSEGSGECSTSGMLDPIGPSNSNRCRSAMHADWKREVSFGRSVSESGYPASSPQEDAVGRHWSSDQAA